jgi:peptidoglycan/LPS O-acetylase OafA/YrhL
VAISGRSDSGRVPELDGLRGLAILSVVAWHYVAVPLMAWTGPVALVVGRSLRLAWSGVDLFFVLSGFLIGGVLLDHRDCPRYFRAFYARRACRILPLYILWFGLFLLLPAIAPRFAAQPALDPLFRPSLPTWSYATFTQNLWMARHLSFGAEWMGITWSLAIEEQFYLALPLLIRFVPARRLPGALAALGLAAPVLRALAGPRRYFTVYVLTPCRADALLLGVLCAYLLRQEDWRRAILRARPALHGLIVVVILALGGLCLFRHPGFEGSPYLPSLLAVFYGSILLLAVTGEAGPIPWLLRRVWLRRLGLVAYGVYLLHPALDRLAHACIVGRSPALQAPAEIAATAVAGVATWALAALSWKCFERPLIALGHRVAYGDRPAAGPAEAGLREVGVEHRPTLGRPDIEAGR